MVPLAAHGEFDRVWGPCEVALALAMILTIRLEALALYPRVEGCLLPLHSFVFGDMVQRL